MQDEVSALTALQTLQNHSSEAAFVSSLYTLFLAIKLVLPTLEHIQLSSLLSFTILTCHLFISYQYNAN